MKPACSNPSIVYQINPSMLINPAIQVSTHLTPTISQTNRSIHHRHARGRLHLPHPAHPFTFPLPVTRLHFPPLPSTGTSPPFFTPPLFFSPTPGGGSSGDIVDCVQILFSLILSFIQLLHGTGQEPHGWHVAYALWHVPYAMITPPRGVDMGIVPGVRSCDERGGGESRNGKGNGGEDGKGKVGREREVVV